MAQQQNQKTVLIVDDTPENIDVLRGAVKNDYKVKIATNGKKALSIAHNNPKPDIILLDIMMPEMDGYEVCKKLKSSENTKEIPIIFLSAKNDERSEAKGLELGAVDYITKPFGVSIVKSRVKIHLELKHVREALENQNAILKIKIKDLEKKISAHDFEGAAKSLTSLTENLEQ